MVDPCTIIPIPNPFVGKPAYVTASEPCPKVCKPCELQEPPDDPDPPVEEPQPMTPPCFAIVFASNPSVPLQQFTYNATEEEYEAPDGSTAHYDEALGYIINDVSTGSYTASPPSLNPVNSYSRQNGDAIATVLCDSVPPPVPEIPDCVESVYTDDAVMVLGQWSATGTGSYTPADPAQGSFDFIPGLGWRIISLGVTYNGGTDPNVPTGVFTASNGDLILIKTCT